MVAKKFYEYVIDAAPTELVANSQECLFHYVSGVVRDRVEVYESLPGPLRHRILENAGVTERQEWQAHG